LLACRDSLTRYASRTSGVYLGATAFAALVTIPLVPSIVRLMSLFDLMRMSTAGFAVLATPQGVANLMSGQVCTRDARSPVHACVVRASLAHARCSTRASSFFVRGRFYARPPPDDGCLCGGCVRG
jgi:hypothetical protein